MTVSAEASGIVALAAAQEAVLAEWSAGGFGRPDGAHWDASMVLAHLIVNERLIHAVTNSLARGQETDYDNAPGQDAFVLRTEIRAAGDQHGLMDALRQAFAESRAALEELPVERRMNPVHVRIWHEGARIVDAPSPWWGFAVTASAEFHLPAHLQQLRDLRP